MSDAAPHRSVPWTFSATGDLRISAVDALIAEPVLRILAANVKTNLGIAEAWAAFKAFLALPYVESGADASFQIRLSTEGTGSAEVCFFRELFDGNSSDAIRVGFQFVFDPAPHGLAEAELWASQFPSVVEFAQVVEGLPAFPIIGDWSPVSAIIVADHEL